MRFWSRKPTRLRRLLAAAALDDALGRVQRPVQSVPAGTLIYTPSGEWAHLKSAVHPGALCPLNRNREGPWRGLAPEEREYARVLPLCPGCRKALSSEESSPS